MWVPGGRRRGGRAPRCCSSATASRSAAGSAPTPARCGASAAWATPRASATSRSCSAPSTRSCPTMSRPCSGAGSCCVPSSVQRTSSQWQRGATPQRRLAHEVGADAHRPASPTSSTGPRRVRGPLQRPRARAPARCRATASASSSTASSPARSTSTSVQRGPFQNAYVGYWIDEAQRRAAATCPRRSSSLVRYAFEELAPAPPADRDHPAQHGAAAAWSRSSTSARRASPLRYLEINGVWEDHVRYAITAEEWEERRDELLVEWT